MAIFNSYVKLPEGQRVSSPSMSILPCQSFSAGMDRRLSFFAGTDAGDGKSTGTTTRDKLVTSAGQSFQFLASMVVATLATL